MSEQHEHQSPSTQDAAGTDAYAAHLDAFGAELRRAASRRAPRRRGPLVLVGAGGLAAAAAVIVLASSPSAGPVDVVARAEAALAPRGELLHYVVRSSVGTAAEGVVEVTPDAYGCSRSGPTEVWQAIEPRRWRVVLWPAAPEAKCGRLFGRDGRAIVGRQELSYADGTTTTYIREHGALETIRGYAPTGSASIVPIGNRELGGGDPVTTIRRMLASGQLHDRGERTVVGRQVRVLFGRQTEGSRKYRGVRETTYLVDAKNFEPVRSIQKFLPSARARGNGLLAATQPMAVQVDFERFDRRPLDADGERQLVIQPGRVVRRTDMTQEELRQQIRRTSPKPKRG